MLCRRLRSQNPAFLGSSLRRQIVARTSILWYSTKPSLPIQHFSNMNNKTARRNKYEQQEPGATGYFLLYPHHAATTASLSRSRNSPLGLTRWILHHVVINPPLLMRLPKSLNHIPSLDRTMNVEWIKESDKERSLIQIAWTLDLGNTIFSEVNRVISWNDYRCML